MTWEDEQRQSMKKQEVTDFSKRQFVAYIPSHVTFDLTHPDAEYGVVSSIGDANVFVRYFNPTIGEFKTTAQATTPENLYMIESGEAGICFVEFDDAN